jgi:hypothetical protein
MARTVIEVIHHLDSSRMQTSAFIIYQHKRSKLQVPIGDPGSF